MTIQDGGPPPATRDARTVRAIRWLRVSFRTGAVVDAIAAAEMLVAPLFAFGPGLAPVAPDPRFRYAMGMAAALMLGWTALLLWADRRPLERRGVLGVTVLVVLGLAANLAVAVRAGFLPLRPVAGIWLVQAALVALFVASLAGARHLRFEAKYVEGSLELEK